jgi:ComF family protein
LLKFGPVLKTFKVDDVECFHLYFYNEKVQELLYQFKGCYDYELYSVFLEYYLPYLNIKFNRYEIIPAPSSQKSDKERGFNHIEEMFKKLRLKMIKCIHKTKQRKQADLTTKEREKIGEYLTIDDVDLSGKKILLVDDVYTTGSTIKSMIKLVKEKGAKKIKVLLMSKTIDLEKR